MNKYIFHALSDECYIGIITILDYEIRTNKHLTEIELSPFKDDSRKILVDLALKTGIDRYRFVEFGVNRLGKIEINSAKNVQINDGLLDLANGYLKEQKSILKNSMLTNSEKEELLEA